ncbi:MAG: GGDEF domain-containing protein [Lachnospiraceae bacterium]|nr:GGDEF domain-containing protein [Lachnospiraceae bacterium]
MDKTELLNRIGNFIGKDTMAENESKKLVVVIRILILSIILYFLISAVLCSVSYRPIGVLLYIAFAVMFVGIFGMTYRYNSLPVLLIFNVGMIIWIYITVHYVGWNIGVQHYLMVLLILCFFSTYKHYTGKILFAVFLCAFRMMLFFIYNSRIPAIQISEVSESGFQCINTVTIFWCISVIAFIFSKDTQKLEGKLVEYNNQLMVQANTDILTGLYNRRKGMEYMEELSRKSVNNIGFSLCICDIDLFKKVNDQYGHDVGDEVLIGISEIFQKEMKKGNFAARWGGEEFLLLFPACNGDEAWTKVDEIRSEIKKLRFQGGDSDFGITMTFGLAEYDFIRGLKATIKEADEKLYAGKEQGRDRIVF